MPRVAGAQRKTMPVIGYLGNTPGNPLSFLRGLSEAGYAVEENVRIEYRWAQGRYDRLPALAAELVERKVDVIVSILGPTGTLAAKGATSIIPIVFLSGDDPVERGLVTNLARPSGNVTGGWFVGCRVDAETIRTAFRAGSARQSNRCAR
jgi:putative ABC transport system substrate-binding protein